MAATSHATERTWSDRLAALLPFGVFAVSLAITIVAASALRRSADDEDRRRFDELVQEQRTLILSRLETYATQLRATAGLFEASGDVTHEEFRMFVARQEIQPRFPGIQGTGYSKVVA